TVLERAVAYHAAHRGNLEDRARAGFALARALGGGARARALAEAARADLAAIGSDDRRDHDAVDRWLSARAAPPREQQRCRVRKRMVAAGARTYRGPVEEILGLDRTVLDRARLSRDPRFDGKFFIAVTSTGIYCRPVCPSRSSKSVNVRYYATAAE